MSLRNQPGGGPGDRRDGKGRKWSVVSERDDLEAVRTGNDFLVLSRDPTSAEEAVEISDRLLEDLDLDFNRAKAAVTGFDRGFRLLVVAFVADKVYAPYDRKPKTPAAVTVPPPLDLLEELRPALVDRFTLSLVNLGTLTRADFAGDADHGVSLTREGLQRYFAAFEKELNAEHPLGDDDEKASFRDLFRRQAHRLAHALRDGTPYEPLRLPC